MTPLRVLSILGGIVGLLLLAVYCCLLFLNYQKASLTSDLNQSTNEEDSFVYKTIPEQKSEEIIEEPLLQESGWIPNWAFDLGYESLVKNSEAISTVNPVLYTINTTGDVVPRGVPEEKIRTLVEYSKEHNILIIPTVGSYDFPSMASLLQSKEKREVGMNTLLSEVEKYGFDGVDLDFENVLSSEKEGYFLFLKDLKSLLAGRDLLLSVCVFPQWKDGVYHEKWQETISVQDYERIGVIADEVRIMAYDFTLQSSVTPGPVSPLDWVTEVLDYAIQYVPRERIWLGIPLYSYEWIQGKVVALTDTSVRSLLNNRSISREYKESVGEGYARFGCGGNTECVLYFQTREGIKAKRDLAKDYGIAGVSYWRLGGDVDLLER